MAVTLYSTVPNNRADPNKGTEWQLFQKLINEQTLISKQGWNFLQKTHYFSLILDEILLLQISLFKFNKWAGP